MKQKSLRARMQAFGGFLTAMVIPNMGAFIAWGFLTALFIDTGWMPNKAFSQIVSPMSKYLLPLLISFMGGKLIGGDRGGVAGTIGTIGLIKAINTFRTDKNIKLATYASRCIENEILM